MATDIDELQIQIQASAKGANSSVTALTKRLEKLSNVISVIDEKKVNNLGIGINSVGRGGNTASAGLNKTATSATKAAKSFDGLASAFGKFYATYFLFIRGAKGIWRNIESSMDYVETSNYFSVALGQIGQQFEEAGYETAELYTEALTSELSDLNRKLTGYSLGESGEALFSGDVGLGTDIEQMMNFQAKTLAVTNSVGLMGEASLQTAKAVSMLSGDLSSLTNTDLESVMTNLSSGLIGQSRALYKYGIDITQNTLQQYALAEGIEKSVAEMTQAEKMQLRLLAILDQSTVAQTDLANTINSVANQYRVFEQQTDNLGRTIGNLFLPIVQNVLPYVNGLIIALNNLFTTLGFNLYGDTWLEDLQQGISGGTIPDDFDEIGESADGATESINAFKKGIRGFDELNVLTGGKSIGTGTIEELEGQIDLTDSITKAVADYENAWDEAFAGAENKASEFAKKLTEDFGDVAEIFEAILPAIAGIGGALATYKIATGISGIMTSLGALGSPVGIAALAAGVLVGVGTAIKQVHDNAVEADLEKRFGDISLSMEDIDRVARNIIDNGNLTALSTVLSEMGELGDIESEIQTAVNTLDRLNWKVSIGMELSEEEQGQYKSAIDSYVKNANDYVTQQQYSTIVGIKLFLGDSQTSEEVQGVVNEFYGAQSEKLRKLGEDLNRVTTEAWNDGLLTIDEAETIANIQLQMANIQREMANSDFKASLQLLESDYSGADLTPETFKELEEKRQELIDQYKEDYNESLKFTLSNINLAYEAKIKAAVTMEDKKDIQEDWDNAIKELIAGRDLQISQMMLQSMSFDYSAVADTFGNDLEKTYDGVSEKFQNLTERISNGDTEFLGVDLGAFSGLLVKQFKKVAGNAGQENFGEILELMTPASELEKTAQSLYEQTGQIPKSIADALISQYALEAIDGNVHSLFKFIYASAENSKDKEAVLEFAKENGYNIPEFFGDAVADGTMLATGSVTDMLENISDILKTSNLVEEAENLGEKTAEAFAEGVDNFTPIAIDGTVGKSPTSFSDVAKKASEKSLNKVNDEIPVDEVNDTMKMLSQSTEKTAKALDEVVKNIGKVIDSKNTRGLDFSNISFRARGGLVTAGEVFVARENGLPEMIGSFGNHTAVANNDQIVAGIQAGVYSAVVSALSETSRNNSGGDIVINMDGAEVFRVVRTRANEHFRATGNSAFDF